MSRHTKNAATRPFFTYQERRKYLPGWGTQKERVGGDSLLDFGMCPLCLKPWTEPLCCGNGDVFCKECIYTSLLTQKQEIAKATEVYENKKRQRDAAVTKAEIDSEQQAIEDFENYETAAVPKRSKALQPSLPSEKSGKTASGAFSTPGARGHEGLLKDRSELRCFWVPDMTPQSTEEAVLKPPNKETTCPQGNHPLRLKQLFALKLTPLPGIEIEDPNRVRADRYQCPACHKTLTKACKVMGLKGCGHVVCSKCLEGVLKEEIICYVCAKPVSQGNAVRINAGGTGFSGHGEQLIAKKQNPVVALS